MKSVLISIKPKWCELIASGEKTIEVRKTRPKLEMPFKCYIYATKSGNRIILKNDRVFEISKALTGKVIGEFVCNNIYDCRDLLLDDICLTVEEWLKYTNGHKGIVYGWQISDLKIYDKPKELSEFSKYGFDEPVPLKRPPQSWMYVEAEAVKALEDRRKSNERS